MWREKEKTFTTKVKNTLVKGKRKFSFRPFSSQKTRCGRGEKNSFKTQSNVWKEKFYHWGTSSTRGHTINIGDVRDPRKGFNNGLENHDLHLFRGGVPPSSDVLPEPFTIQRRLKCRKSPTVVEEGYSSSVLLVPFLIPSTFDPLVHIGV